MSAVTDILRAVLQLPASLQQTQQQIEQIQKEQQTIMVSINDLRAKAAAEKTVIDGLTTTISDIVKQDADFAKQLRDLANANDPAALNALADDMDKNTTALMANVKTIADAVIENTPAAAPPNA